MWQYTQEKTNQTYSKKLQSKEKNDDSKPNQCSEVDFSVEDKAPKQQDRVLKHVSDGDKQSPTPPTNAVVADFYRNSARAKKLRAEAIMLKAEAIEDELRAWSLENGYEIPICNTVNPGVISTDPASNIEPDECPIGDDKPKDIPDGHLEGDHKKSKARRPYKKQDKVLKIEQTIKAKFPAFLEAEDEDDKESSPDVLTMVAKWMNEVVGITGPNGGYSDRNARRYLNRLFSGWHDSQEGERTPPTCG